MTRKMAFTFASIFMIGCGPTAPVVSPGLDGESIAMVQIDSSPTPAWIYIDNLYVGTTPLEHDIAYSSSTEHLEIVAEPIFPGQIRQSRRLTVRPMPYRVHFFMNNSKENIPND